MLDKSISGTESGAAQGALTDFLKTSGGSHWKYCNANEISSGVEEPSDLSMVIIMPTHRCVKLLFNRINDIPQHTGKVAMQQNKMKQRNAAKKV